MSSVDSEQDKQPISSVNGQAGDNDIGSAGKGETEDHAPSTEGLKGILDTETTCTAIVSDHGEEAQSPKEGVNDNEAKDSQSPEITNGEIAGGHENEKEGESPVAENKLDETPEEVLDNKQVNNGVDAADIENEMVEAGKEVEKAAEQNEPEKSNDVVTAMEDEERNKVETEPVELEKAVDELKEGVVVDEKQTEVKSENQPSEENKVAVTEPEAADRKRAVTIDNPVDMNELTSKSGESPRKTEDVHGRSRTLPVKEDVARSQTTWYVDEVEDTPSKPESAATEETVSYSTSIVGGVVHRMPISSSPKTQHKPKEGSPQLSPSKKRSVIDSLLGRHKKSKGSPESPQRASASVQDAEKESQEGVSESTAKGDTEPLESGASAEVDEAKSPDVDQETQVKAAAEKEGGGDEIKLAPVAQSEEDIKEDITETKEGEVESQEVQEVQKVPVPVEGAEEKDETSAEALEGEQPQELKDGAKRAHSDLPDDEETSPQPAAKKKKPIFGGIFTPRKSKKSKGDLGSPPAETAQEKEGAKADDEHQGESVSTEPADDAKPQAVEEVETVENGTDQGGSPDASQITNTAQREATGDVINPVADQAVESAKEEIADELEQEVQIATGGDEPGAKEEETVKTEDVQKSAEEPVQSTDSGGTVDDQQETEQQPVHSQDTQPEKKHSFFSGFFARRKSKKLKESPAETPQEKSDNVEEQQPSRTESTQAADDTKLQAVVAVETLENGADEDAAPETNDATAGAQQQEATDDAISPKEDQAVESAKEDIADKEKVDEDISEQGGEAATEGEPSGKEEETVVPEDTQKPAEEPLTSKDADATVEKQETEEVPVQSQRESQPEKKHSIFSGLFARRKSKKSKGEVSDTPGERPQEKEGDQAVEEQQDGSASTQAADDVAPQALESEEKQDSAVTDQDAPPIDTSATVQQEVTEVVISAAVDQVVESAKEDIADQEKADENIAEQGGEAATEGESSGKEEETVVPDDTPKPAEKPVTSKDADATVEKKEAEEVPVQSQESQPEKKHSIFSGLFARRKSKKSKGDVPGTAVERPQEKEGDQAVEEQQGGSASTQAADDGTLQASESEDKQDSAVTDQDAPLVDTSATVQQEVTEVVISAAVDQVVESAKEDIADREKVDENIAEQGGEAATEGESSGKEEETVVPEDTQEQAEEPGTSKDADDSVETKEAEVPVQSQESQPEKKHSIFSGLFARRKSKKSKGDVSGTPGERPQEKEGDQAVEEQQGGSASAQAADDVTPQALESEEKQGSAVTDQAAPPIDTSATVQPEVTEVVISPAVDQAVESAKEDKTDKVDGNVGEQETTSEHESSGKEVETKGTEDVKKSTEEESEMVNHKPKVEEPSEDTSKETSDSGKTEGEKEPSPESEEAQDKGDVELQERIALTHGSHSPKTHRMQMRISYAETIGEGGREVEVIGTPERVSEATNQKGKTPPDHRVSCRDLGEADHEGWLAKKGGPLFFSSWKRKWVVLKEGKLYYFQTSFDPEAKGVINMEGVTVAPAPETKKNFCFKCEQPGPKPQVSLFMADSKEDLEKWLTVLKAASKGEVIHKTKQHHLTPMGEVVMRKKSGSISTQRTSSVLAVGGRHDLFEDEEDLRATRRRSTPGSLSRSPEKTQGKEIQPSVSSATHPVISETHPVPEDTQPVLSDTQEVSEPSKDKPEETRKSSEGETTEKPLSVVDEVLVSSEEIAVESVPVTEVSDRQDAPAVESSSDPAPEVASSQDVEEGSKGQASVPEGVTAEVESAQPEQESAPDVSDSTVEETDGNVSIVTTKSSVTVVETIKSASVFSEKVETAVSVVETEVKEVSSAQQPSETDELKQDAKEDIEETSPTRLDEPVSPSKTKWYFTLDRQETWSVPPEVEPKISSSPPKSPGSSSDKVSIKSDRGSIKSDKGSIKSSSEDDDLLVMFRNVRRARLSIVGDHVLDCPERMRALSSVHDGNDEAVVKLRTLERTLKDKEKHLSEIEELLTQPEINRDSIYAWKLRYSDLVEEFFPQYDGDTQEVNRKPAEGGESEEEENKKAAEGGESEPQDQENSKAGTEDEEVKSSEESEKEVKEQTLEEVAKKSDEEQTTASKDDDERKMDDKQVADEGKEERVRDQETVQEEQPSSEKREDSEQNEENNVTVEIQQIPTASVSITDSEQSVQETGTEHDKQRQEEETVSNSDQRLPDNEEQSLEQEDSEDVQDTRF